MVNHIFQWRTIVKPLHNNLPQIIPKCSTNIMILIHGQPHVAQHKALQAMNLWLVNHLHQFSLLPPYEIPPHKKWYKVEGRVSVMKGIGRQKKQRNYMTYGIRDPFYLTFRYQNTWTQAIKEISEEMSTEQDLIVKKMSSLRT